MSEKKANTRERILASASRALLQRGAAEPRVSDVMTAAGLTVGGFYAHFASKDALMLEAFRHLLGQRRYLVAQLSHELPAEQRRALLAAFYLSRKHRDGSDEGCPIPSTVGEVGRLPDDFRQALAEHVELMVAHLSGAPEDVPDVLADIALMVGGLALARALGPGELSDRVLRAAKAAIV